jgi:hypothetical protein
MPDWLAEPDTTLLLGVAVAALAAAVIAFRARTRTAWMIAASAFLLLGGLFLIDRLFASDREKIIASVQTMADAVDHRDLDRVFSQISETFSYGPVLKPAFRQFCADATRNHRVDSMKVWNIQVMQFNQSHHQAEVRFQFKIKAGGRLGGIEEVFYTCKAIYILDADGQWRLQTFRVYPMSTADQPLTIPGLG